MLADWAEHCSQTEREAAKVELKADDIVLAHLLKRRLNEQGWQESVFEGQVISLTRRGMFLLFDRLFQGYLSCDELPRDYWELNELETAMVGKRSNRAYKIADLLQVRVVAIDEARGRVDLTLAGAGDGDAEGDGFGDGDSGDASVAGAPDTGGPGSASGKPGDNRQSGSRGPQHGSRKPKTTRTRSARAGRPPQARGRGRGRR